MLKPNTMVFDYRPEEPSPWVVWDVAACQSSERRAGTITDLLDIVREILARRYLRSPEGRTP